LIKIPATKLFVLSHLAHKSSWILDVAAVATGTRKTRKTQVKSQPSTYQHLGFFTDR